MIYSCRKLKFGSIPIDEPQHSPVGVKMHILKACLLRARFSPAGGITLVPSTGKC